MFEFSINFLVSGSEKTVGYSDVPNDPFCVFQALEGALRTSDQEWYRKHQKLEDLWSNLCQILNIHHLKV